MIKLLTFAALIAVALGTPGVVAAEPASPTHGQAEHVVVVVWDGMRPDFISPQYTPTLYQLAVDGVFFKNHHPVYVSSTEANGTAIATGVYPAKSGIIANRDYRPESEWLDSMATESVESIRRGDAASSGRYIDVPTVAEILHQAGFPTAIAGTKPVTLLHDRSNRRAAGAAANSTMLYHGHTIPSSLLEAVVKANEKDFPASATPNVARDAWTTKGLTHTLWKKGVPKFSLLWLSEPDASQHAAAPGSDMAVSALESCDKNLATVLQVLEDKKVRQKTDVLVVSDHGFSTIQRGVDVAEILKKAKFKAGRKLEDPEPGEVLVVGLGGSVLLYVIEHDETVTRKLVEFLQTTDFAGVIFSRLKLPGTFPIEQVRMNTSKTAPDVILSMRWSADTNEHGTPGMLQADTGKKGTGTHASLSRFDMHNTLVANGPDFRVGLIDELPSGNADLAPTLLALLGVPSSSPMDGRILQEALRTPSAAVPKPNTQTLEATFEVGLRRWKQYLKFTTIGDQIYFDEGNGEAVLK